jgi:cell division protein FtsB
MTETSASPQADDSTSTTTNNSMSNVLAHIAALEKRIDDLSKTNTELNAQLEQKDTRIKSLSEKTQEAMQSFAETLLKKWVDACETKDPAVKSDFIEGVNNIIKNSDETNGVWQMMVVASSLHDKQEHDLDKLRAENVELRTRVDGLYSDSASRVDGVGSKRPSTEQLDRGSVPSDSAQSTSMCIACTRALRHPSRGACRARAHPSRRTFVRPHPSPQWGRWRKGARSSLPG